MKKFINHVDHVAWLSRPENPYLFRGRSRTPGMPILPARFKFG